MKITTEHFTRFKQPSKDARCSVKINGEYIFSSIEAKRLGSKLTERYGTKKISYSDEEDFKKALEEMPDYECWDSKNKVLIKAI